jgi:exodeoxyribonuclease VII large subunit
VPVEAIDYGDRRVYSVASFNRGVAGWLERLPTVWVEGEVTELRRQQAWQTVFFTLKDPADGACLGVTMQRGRFDALRLDLEDGARVHVYGRPELFAARGDFRLRALTIELFGLGRHLATLERLKAKLAAEGLFAEARKRPLPRVPRRIGLVTGSDAAAKRDVVATITARFPAARIVVAETLVQGPRAAAAVVDALARVAAEPEIDVVVVTRGGGSFEDLLPFSDERLVRAIATCPVPVVSAVGHEQDTPLCDLAADMRASTPTMAAKLVVPDARELAQSLSRSRAALERCTRRALDRERQRTALVRDRLGRAPALGLQRERQRLAILRDRLRAAPRAQLERRRTRLDNGWARLRALSPRATLQRGYAIVRTEDRVVRSSSELSPDLRVDVELAEGGFAGRVEELR